MLSCAAGVTHGSQKASPTWHKDTTPENYPKLLKRSSLHTLVSKGKAVLLTLNYHKIGLWCAINENTVNTVV